MQLNKLTPVCTVDRIEDCLPFWIERLGFTQVAAVPEGDALGFVMLQRDEVTVMLQSRSSVAADIPALADGPLGGGVMLFIDVADLDPVLATVEGADIIVPERETFYGTREVWVRSPGGHVVGFAQQIKEPE